MATPADRSPYELADLYCRRARRKIASLFRAVDRNDDSLAYKIARKTLDGRYSWLEEVLAGVARRVPYNAEEEMRRRGAIYQKGLLPFTSYVVVDGRLVSGQNPQSARATAQKVAMLW